MRFKDFLKEAGSDVLKGGPFYPDVGVYKPKVRTASNPKLTDEMKQVMQFVEENRLGYARSWLRDAWLEYKGQ